MNTRPVFFRVSRNRKKAASAPSMRPKALSGSIAKYSRGLVLSALALIGAPAVSQAADYYWDGGGADANWSTTGNWSTLGTSGTNSNTAGPPASGDNVVFYRVGGTQLTTGTLNTTAFTIKSLTFGNGQTGAVTIAQGTGGTLTLNGMANYDPSVYNSGASSNLGTVGVYVQSGFGAINLGTGGQNLVIGNSQQWINNSANDFRIRSLVNGGATTLTLAGTGTGMTYLSGGLTLSGAGGLVISKTGNNSITNSGTWIFQNNITLGGTGGLTISSGAAPVVLGAGTVNVVQITANQNWTNNSSNALYIGGALTITFQLSLTAGTFTFGNYANTGAGGVVINGGTAEAGNNATFGTGTLTLASGTVSSDTINARSFTNAVTVNGNVTIGNATKNGALTFTNTINLGAATRTFTTASNATFGGIVSNGGLTKAGTGVLTLSGNGNSYTGTTTVNGGTLLFTRTSALYNGTTGSWTAANITVGNGATLALHVGGTNEFTTGNVTTLLTNLGGLGGTVSSNGLQAGSAVAFDTTNASGSNFTVADNIANSTGTGSGAIGLTKLGTNTLTLSGTNTYTGGTTVNAGTLLLTVPSALYNNTPASWTAANITVARGATLALGVGGAGFTSGNVDTIKAIGTASTGFTNGSFLGLDTSNGDFSYSTAIGNTNGGENSVGLVKLGNNILTLSNANTFTGTTTVTTGTLALTNNLALQNSALDTTGSGVLTFTGASAPTIGGLNGSVNLATKFTTGYSSVGTVTLNPVSGVTATYSGVIANGTMALTKTGLGTQILSGANTYTGTTTINAGTLTVNTQTGSLSTSSAISMGGGTFNLDNTGAGAPLTRSYGSLTFSSGDGTVNITRTAAQNQAITFSSPGLGALGAGATGNFVNTGGTNGTANGFILSGGATAGAAMGPGYFFNGGTANANYAYYNAAASFVRGINWGSAEGSTQAGGAIATAAYAQSTGSTAATIATGRVFTGLNFQNTTDIAQAVTLAGTITTNGILRSGNGASTTTISGGTSIKTTTAGANLVIRTDMANDALTISTPILANGASGLTKSGNGTLVLSGTTSDYSGQTYVNAGTLNIQHSSALGTSTTTTVASGGKLRLEGVGITIGSGTTLTISQPTMSTFDGSITSGTATGTATSNGVYNLLTVTTSAGAAAGFPATSDSATLNVTRAGSIEYLVVGGGGGGGTNGNPASGGGGGAGGVVVGNQTFGAASYIVSVGRGGQGAQNINPSTLSVKGGNSVLGTLTALGGGGVSRSGIFLGTDDDGGSGGGMYGGSETVYTAGTGLQPSSASGGFGNNGGTAVTSSSGGGGGGAGSVGGNAVTTTGGNGGSGFTTSITGVSTSYAGGGGGGGSVGGTATAGGGSGGAGAANGSNATANTGGGGGGGGGTSGVGGHGGSGIVVIRYVGAALENVSGDNTWNGAITLGSSIGISSRLNTLTLGGAIGDSSSGYGITKLGDGTVALTVANTYTGATTVSAGTLEVTANTALGTIAAGTSVTAGATLKLTNVNYITAEGLTINGAGAGGAGDGALVSSGASTFAGLITAVTNATINAGNGTLALSGGIVKDGTTLTFKGAGGTITISGTGISGASAFSDLVVDGTTVIKDVASTYNGPTTITNGGTLIANVTGALPLSPRSAFTFSGSGSPTLNLGANQEVASLSSSTTSAVVNLSATGTRTLTVGIAGGPDTTFAGSITGTGGNLIKDTNSKQILSGSNGYTGTTTVSAGTLEVTGSLSGTTAVTVSTGGTLLMNGGSNNVGTGDRTPVASSQTINGSVAGANFTGSGGTLAVAQGAGGNGTTHSFNQMTLTANSTLDFSSGAGTTNTNVNLIFASLNSATKTALFNGTTTLTINGWGNTSYTSQLGTGPYTLGTSSNPGAVDGGSFGDGQDRLIFTTDPGFGLGNFIAGINFTGFGAGATQVAFGSGFEIVPVPEPATTALIGSIALCALIGYRERRRFTGLGKRTAARK